jgi:hypothetical protein
VVLLALSLGKDRSTEDIQFGEKHREDARLKSNLSVEFQLRSVRGCLGSELDHG